ncbi:hypothetical protein PGLA_17380 [Paenibacillus glacialis]|uniref:Uncharacterized protein n=1 Tax=Paenibacillus glacialis TaxID=494026 RepID=A0A162MA88_9BACL|nr:hypothetical protein PGLA_17380 [Paenibacillus glacialis]
MTFLSFSFYGGDIHEMETYIIRDLLIQNGCKSKEIWFLLRHDIGRIAIRYLRNSSYVCEEKFFNMLLAEIIVRLNN